MSSLHTSPHLQTDALSRLGLDEARLGRPVKLRQSSRRASRRFDDDEVGFGVELYPPGSRPAIEIGDLMVQACASNREHVFAVRSSKGSGLGVHTTADDVPWAEAGGDGDTVYIAPQAGSAVSVVGPDGKGLLVVHEQGKGVYAYDIERATHGPDAAVAQVAAPTWLLECGPRWAQDAIQGHLRVGGALRIAMAVGIAARTATSPDDQPTASISLLLAGLPDADAQRSQGWFAAQPSRFRAAVRAAAIAHSLALADTLDAVEVRMLRGVPIVPKTWIDAAVAREDLEGARLLLQATGEATEVNAALYAVDTAGARICARSEFPGFSLPDRCCAAAVIDPDAWWTGC